MPKRRFLVKAKHDFAWTFNFKESVMKGDAFVIETYNEPHCHDIEVATGKSITYWSGSPGLFSNDNVEIEEL